MDVFRFSVEKQGPLDLARHTDQVAELSISEM